MTREEHIENLKAIASDMPSDKCSDWIESLMAGVKALEQEPFINKPCVSEKVCEHDKQMVLDKIRAEIQKLRNCSCSNSDGIIDDVEDILDKYTAEGSEE